MNPANTTTLTTLRDALSDALTPPVVVPPPVIIPPPVIVPPPNNSPLLSSARLKYAGLFRLPYQLPQTAFGFAVGAFTCRRVNGELRFLAAGFKNSGFPVSECAFPGVGPTIMSAPRAALITNWGSCYAPMPVASVGAGIGLRALHWHNDQLYWAYGDEYDAAGNHDPCIGTTILKADGTHQAFGTWRTQQHSQKTRGFMLDIPAAFQAAHGVGPVGFGCPNTSGNATSPWGVPLATGTMPSNGTPADPIMASQPGLLPPFSIPNQSLIYHDIGHAQPRNANFKFCGYNVKYDPTKGGSLAPGTPSWLDMDQVTAMVWVDLPDCQGVMAIGQIVETIPGYAYEDGDTQTHVWYGPPTCVHGQNGGGVSVSVGPAAGSMIPKAWFYDPNDLAKVAGGALDPNKIAPIEELNLSTISRLAPRVSASYQYGAAYFDAPTRSIFVSQSFADSPDPYSPSPVIHQFVIV